MIYTIEHMHASWYVIKTNHAVFVFPDVCLPCADGTVSLVTKFIVLHVKGVGKRGGGTNSYRKRTSKNVLL